MTAVLSAVQILENYDGQKQRILLLKHGYGPTLLMNEQLIARHDGDTFCMVTATNALICRRLIVIYWARSKRTQTQSSIRFFVVVVFGVALHKYSD